MIRHNIQRQTNSVKFHNHALNYKCFSVLLTKLNELLTTNQARFNAFACRR